ncbi:MAG: SRPBCC domain-containing protein [Nanoarchaeota archaeon]|nr:SRPBCC domain-containing protein [Nanoarchaeota archaeon]
MKTLNHTVHFNAKPEDIYEYLMNARKFANITGGKASNPGKISGKFSYYDEYIQGSNVELSPGKKIVWKWTCADFPNNHTTTVTIIFKKKGDKQTELDFTQDNIPDDFYDDIAVAWKEFYWEPIKDYIEYLMWK